MSRRRLGKDVGKSVCLDAPGTSKTSVFSTVFNDFYYAPGPRKTTPEGSKMEAKWLPNPAQDHLGLLWEGVQKIDQKMIKIGVQMGAKMEAKWEPKSMEKRV